MSTWDGTVRLFDLPTQTQIGSVLNVPYDVTWVNHYGATLAPDGSRMAVATRDGVQLWDLDPAGWEAAACRLAGRNLTVEEWERYLPPDLDYRATCPEWPADT